MNRELNDNLDLKIVVKLALAALDEYDRNDDLNMNNSLPALPSLIKSYISDPRLLVFIDYVTNMSLRQVAEILSSSSPTNTNKDTAC